MVANTLFNADSWISFNQEKHSYTNPSGHPFRSVTKLLNTIEVPFDREGISRRMAEKKAVKDGISVDQAQELILEEWEEKKNNAGDRGNWIHDNLELYLKQGTYDPKLQDVIQSVTLFIRETYKFYPEAMVYNDHYKVAGMTDLCLQRQRSKNSIFDFYDYKTNEAKGIQLDSIRRKGDIQHYNKFFLAPLDHLEDCNYNRYSLQLSLYACLASLTWNIRIGKLGIIFIDNKLDVTLFPVPYMKLEAMALLEHSRNLKPIPEK